MHFHSEPNFNKLTPQKKKKKTQDSEAPYQAPQTPSPPPYYGVFTSVVIALLTTQRYLLVV